MTRVTHATVRHIAELEAHAATLSRALGILSIATENARSARDLRLIEAIDREATYLTKQLRRIQQERARIQQELANE